VNTGLGDWIGEESRQFWIRVRDSYDQSMNYQSDLISLRQAEAKFLEEPDESEEKAVLEEKYRQQLDSFNNNHWTRFAIQDIIDGKYDEDQEQAFASDIQNSRFIDKETYRLLGEIKNSFGLYNSYYRNALEARDRLAEDYQSLMGSGMLKDILSEDMSSDDFNLDEYQIALIKAKAVTLYWERRTSIAESVLAYAEELKAGRMTDAEGVKAWEAAKAAYEQSILQYEMELQVLNGLGTELQEKQAVLDSLALAMEEAEALLNRLNAEYSNLIAVNAVNREGYILGELNSRYSSLLDEYTILTKSGTGAVYGKSLESAMNLYSALEREALGEILEALIKGQPGNLESLAELRQKAERIRSFGSGDELPGSADEYGLSPDDPGYSVIGELLKEREILTAAAEEEPEPENLAFILDQLRRIEMLIRASISAAKAKPKPPLKSAFRVSVFSAPNPGRNGI